MDDLHQKPRDTEKHPENAPGRARLSERQNATDQTRTAAPASSNAGDDGTAGGADGAVGEVVNQVSTLVRNVGEQAWSAASNAGGTAQEMVRQARDQVGGVGSAVIDTGTRANDYIARNVNAYPLPALLIAGAVGYGVAYLFHNSWQTQDGGNQSPGRADARPRRTAGAAKKSA